MGMTNQQAFDKVYDALLAQRVASTKPNSSCMYRNRLGHKRAVGHLIPVLAFPKRVSCT